MSTARMVATLSLLSVSCLCWDFGGIGLNGGKLKHVTLYRSRLFLCAPRSSTLQEVTLLEAPWPEFKVTNVKPIPWPSKQVLGDCSCVQSAVSSDVDTRGRMFVLDQGYGLCDPKIIVYDLVANKEQSQCPLRGIPGGGLTSLVLDPATGGVQGQRAYIGAPGGSSLIIYSCKDRHWWRLPLTLGASPSLSPAFMPQQGRQALRDKAILTSVSLMGQKKVLLLLKSKKDTIRVATDDSQPGQLPFSIGTDLAVSKRLPLLYVTSADTDQLYSLSLKELRTTAGPPAIMCNDASYNWTSAAVVELGRKLGPSQGLLLDSMGGLLYFLTRDNAVVRWDTRRPLSAESYNVMLQSSEMSAVSQLFADPLLNIWALLPTPHSQNSTDYCVMVHKYNILDNLI